MDVQNGRIFKEMYHFYSFSGAFAPHHGLLRVNKVSKSLSPRRVENVYRRVENVNIV